MASNEALHQDTIAAVPYSPLDPENQEIRMLYLGPGQDDDEIRIRLGRVRLADTFQYEALSYVWGMELSPKPVLVNNTHHLTITENLDCALRHLRLRTRPRVLWIDALCINQDDVQERSQQVQIMDRIYSRAHQVIIWLGPDHGHNYHNVLLHMDKCRVPDSNASFVQLLRDVCRLGNSAWFSRLWVVQELVLSTNDPMVYIGRYRIPWSAFASGADHFNDCFWEDPESGFDVDDVGLVREFMVQHGRISSFHRLRLSAKQAPLATRLYYTMFQQATDPRDKIYGLLAISRSPTNTVKPDYTLSIQRVLTQTTAILLQDLWSALYSCYPLHYMRHEDSPRFEKIHDLPSWVPDMTLQSKLNRQELDEQEQYWKPQSLLRSAEGGMTQVISDLCHELPRSARVARFTQDFGSLFATGTTLGKITWASVPDSFHGLGAAIRLHDLYHTLAKRKGFTPTDFYRALHVGDDDYHFLTHLWEFEEFLMYYTAMTDDIALTFTEALEDVLRGARNRTLFITDSRRLGQSYHPEQNGIREGDLLVGLFGISFPFILRPLGDGSYKMINIAHVVDHQWGYVSQTGAGFQDKILTSPETCGSQEYRIV